MFLRTTRLAPYTGTLAVLSALATMTPAPVQAATVVQEATWVADRLANLNETTVLTGVGIDNTAVDEDEDRDEFTQSLNPFDASLGTLTSVKWKFEIDLYLEDDNLYGCVGVFSVGCAMDTSIESRLAGQIEVDVDGFLSIIRDGVVVGQRPQRSELLNNLSTVNRVYEPQKEKGLVGCVASELSGLGVGCLDEFAPTTLSSVEEMDVDPLEAYTNGTIDVTFTSILTQKISTDCRLFGVVGSCYSRNFADASEASFKATLTYGYTPFADTPPAPVPLPAGLPLLLAGLGAIGVLRHRAKREA